MVNKVLKQYLSNPYPMVLIPNECITMENEKKEIWLESMLDQGNYINKPNTIAVDALSKYYPAKSKSKCMILQGF